MLRLANSAYCAPLQEITTISEAVVRLGTASVRNRWGGTTNMFYQLLAQNGVIVWVAGVEIAEAFNVGGGAGELFEVSIENEDQEGL